jgi:hypothetical protein
MRKVKTNRRNRIFGLFAMFAMAIGVGVALAPREVVKTEAAVKTFTIGLDNKSLSTATSYQTGQTSNNYNGGDATATLKWDSINPSSGQMRGNQTTNANLQAGANFSIRNSTPLPGNVRTVTINQKGGSFNPANIYVATGAAEIETQADKDSTAGTASGNNVTWTFSGESGGFFALGAKKGSTSGTTTATSVVVTYEESSSGPVFGTLTSIEVENPADKLSFYVGDTFTSEGLTIKAKDNSDPVVEEIIYTGFTTNRDGLVLTSDHKPSLLVTVSYTRASVTKTTTYSVAVEDVPIMKTYKEATSVADLHIESAVYIISGLKSGTPYVMTTTQNANNRAAEETVLESGKVKETIDTQKFELVTGTKPNSFGFKALNGDTAGQYLKAASSSSNYLRSEATLSDNSSWSLTFSGSGVLSAVSQGSFSRNQLKFNASNNPPIFSCYASGQVDISLHMDEDTIPVSGFGTLDKITVDASGAKTSYYAGEKFSTLGLVVTAFDTKPEPDHKVVADYSTSIAEDTVLSAGTHTVTVSYTEGVTKTATYTITVSPAQTYKKLVGADDILYNQIYALGSEDGAASTTFGGFAGEVAVDYNEVSDSFTSVTDLQLVTLGIGAVKGSYTIKLLNGSGAGKYYAWTSGNSLALHTDITEASSWFIDEDTLAITNVGDEERFIGHNHSSVRFAAYTGTSIPKAFLYMDFGSYDVEAEMQVFIDYVLGYHEDYNNGAEGKCHAVFELIDDVFNRLSDDAQLELLYSEEVDAVKAMERYYYLEAWTAANPEPGAPGSVISPNNENSPINATLIIGLLGLTTMAGYYFLSKKEKLVK